MIKKAKKNNTLTKPILILIIGIGFLILAAFVFSYAVFFGPGPNRNSNQNNYFVVNSGYGVNKVAQDLKNQNYINSPLAFKIMSHLSGKRVVIKAGTYQIEKGASLISIYKKLVEGDIVKLRITISEGMTSYLVYERILNNSHLTGSIDVPTEGVVLPETYDYLIGETRQDVLYRMIQAQKDELKKLWAERAPNLPIKSKEEAIILASIVEKETGVNDERERVAAVFINRLNKGMRLESDPTVIYGVSKGRPLGRGLYRSELDTVTPWNTYRIDRLPVTPICNPGLAAIKAVLKPAQTNEYFFVADGTGGHVFSVTYDEHLENVAKWRKIELEQKSQ